MPARKALHDLHSMRSVKTRPISTVQSFIEMNRLAAETQRLERELEMWNQKIERIHKRLTEIEQKMQAQMRELGYAKGCGEAAAPRAADPPTTASDGKIRQVTLEY